MKNNKLYTVALCLNIFQLCNISNVAAFFTEDNQDTAVDSIEARTEPVSSDIRKQWKLKHPFLHDKELTFMESINDLSRKVLVIEAEDLMLLNNYHRALLYLIVYENKGTDLLPIYKYYLGLSLLESNEEKESVARYIEEYIREEEKPEADATFHLGRAHHLNNNFDDAIDAFNEYINNAKKNAPLIEEAKRSIVMCNNAKHLVANPIDATIRNIGAPINSSYSEYVPVISADESILIFTSRRPGCTGGLLDAFGNPDKFAGEYYEDIFYVERKTDSTWSEPVNIGESINTRDHDANIGLSPDGQELFIYKSDGVQYGNIFSSKKDGNTWLEPEKLPYPINTKYWEGSASVSAFGGMIFFSSNRPGGYGGRDIYLVRKLPNGEWAAAMNLGPKVNTPRDEDAPFIHPDGHTLYFSSDGHQSMGGYDIFVTKCEDDFFKEWAEPENFGYPINTANDDIYFVMSANGTGYYSSTKTGGLGESDIFVVVLPQEEKVVPKVLTLVTGFVKANDTEQTPEDAVITVTDNTTGELVGIFKPNKVTGKYVILVPVEANYSIVTEAKGYLFNSQNVNFTAQKDYIKINRNIWLMPKTKGSKLVLKNIFFDFGKSSLREESESELQKIFTLLNDNPDLVVEISGHTDSKGTFEKNISLSQERAQVVVDYLVNRGLDSTRLVAKGYGPVQPIAINMMPDGSDYSEGRDLNRRTEMKILGIEGGNAAELSKKESKKLVEAIKIDNLSTLRRAMNGVWYKIKVAETKGTIPNQFFLGFERVAKETLSDQSSRYTVGLYKELEYIEKYRDKVIEMGVKDAAVIAYFNGKEISIEEAKAKLEN